MWSLLHRFRQLLPSCCAILALALFAPVVVAGEIRDISVGFQGLHKVGYWTPVKVTLAADNDEPLVGILRLTTIDGDGARVSFEAEGPPLTVPAGQTLTVNRKVKFGRLRAGLSVSFVAAEGRPLERHFGPDEFAELQLSDTAMTLTLGPEVGIQQLFDKQSGSEIRAFARQVTSVEDLPDDWLAFEPIDTLVLTTRDNDLLDSLSDAQLSAIRRWVAMGGRLLLSVGSRGAEMFASDSAGPLSRLTEFVPGEFVALSAMSDSAAVESYSGSVQQLVTDESLHAMQLTVISNVRGVTELSNTGARGVQPIVVRAPFGFGQVVFAAFDLDHPLIGEWTGLDPLLVRLLRVSSSATDQVGPSRFGGRVAHVGFTDLAGQMRGALDQFTDVSFVPFYWVAGLVFVYVLLIGPGDYFFLKRVLGKMQWTWLTFPLVVVCFSALAIYLFATLKQGGVRVNQVDLVDIDLETRSVRGSTWADVYSPQTETYTLQWQNAGLLNAISPNIRNVASWQGLPGAGLGGLNTTVTAPAFTDPYRIAINSRSSQVVATPIQVSATKSFQVRWWGETELSDDSQLVMDRNHLLIGEITNPLPVDLEDCSVLFGDWIYRLEGNFGQLAAGDSVRIETERPLNLEWKLTRRLVQDSRDVTTPWNQNSVDVPRILEMMMFHESAGGDRYTELSHRYLSFVDLSHLLKRGRAILLGRGKQRATELQIGDVTAEQQYDQTWAYYRVVFPVQNQPAE